MLQNSSELGCGYLQLCVCFTALMLFYVTVLDILVFTGVKA